MEIFIKSLVRPLIRELIDPRNQTPLWRLCRRWIIRFHPYLHFGYLYRSGHLLAAEKVADKWPIQRRNKYNTVQQVKEMVDILKNGRPEESPMRLGKRSFNRRVLFALHSSLPWHRAGYAIRSQNLLKHLDRQGLQITAVTRPGYPWTLEEHAGQTDFAPEDEVNGIRYLRLPDDKIVLQDGENAYIKHYANQLTGLIQKQKADVIHSSSNYLNGLAGAEAARKTGALAVYEMRGLWHLSRSVIEPGYENSDHYRYCEIMELAAAHESHAVVTLSHALKQHLVRQGVDDNKIHVLPNAVDTDLFAPIQPDRYLVQELGIQNRVVVGFIGSLTGYEGIDILIQAVAALIEQGMPLSLLIVGSGYAEKALKDKAGASSASGHIHFLGQVPFEQIKSYYSVIDIFPFPRTNLPVCRLVPPLKILEAMAMGKAIIASDLPPLLEMVSNGQTGLICKTDDVTSLAETINILCSSEVLRQKLGEAARKWVLDARSWTEIVKNYLRVYTDTN
jgi:glycosyltransferase involved in cell wall biosynthesis